MSNEVVVIPSYQREPILRECLKSLRNAEPDIEVHVFSDRAYFSPELGEITWTYNTNLHVLPKHNIRGNNLIIKTIMNWLISMNFTTTYLVESDVIVKPDFFAWARQHEGSAFGLCGWNAPIPNWTQQSFLQFFSGVTVALPSKSVIQIAEYIKSNHQRSYDLQITDLLYKTQQFCLFPAQRLVDHVGHSGLNFSATKLDTKQDTGFADGYVLIKLNPNRKPVLENGVWRMR